MTKTKATKKKVALLVGSARHGSLNKKLARALERLGQEDFDFDWVRIDHLPLYNGDLEKDFPKDVSDFKEHIAAADALLFVTPEYNRSFTPVLKNAIDWASRPNGKGAFRRQPAAIAGTSQSQLGTAAAQNHLRAVLSHLDVPVMNVPELFLNFKEGLIDDAGHVSNESTEKFLKGFMEKFARWVAAAG